MASEAAVSLAWTLPPALEKAGLGARGREFGPPQVVSIVTACDCLVRGSEATEAEWAVASGGVSQPRPRGLQDPGCWALVGTGAGAWQAGVPVPGEQSEGILSPWGEGWDQGAIPETPGPLGELWCGFRNSGLLVSTAAMPGRST